MKPKNIKPLITYNKLLAPKLQARLSYGLALVFPIAIYYLCANVLFPLFGQTYLLTFMLPIITCAMLGGLGPGLTATLVATICAAILLPPANSLAIANHYDSARCLLLVTNGLLVSAMSGLMHHHQTLNLARLQQLTQIQQQLQQSENLFHSVFAQAAVGIAIVAPDGRHLKANQKFHSILGYDPKDLQSLTYESISHPDDLQKDLAQMQRTLAGDISSYSIEKRYICKNGQALWVNHAVALARKPDMTPDYFIIMAEDIHARKQAEAALFASEYNYRSLFDSMLNGYAHCRMEYENGQPIDFVYLHTNKAFSTLTGLHDVQRKRVSEVLPGLRQSNPEVFAIYGRVALGGQPERFETYVKSMDIWFSVMAYCPEKGYFVAIFDDITKQKQAELKLLESEHRFRQLFEQAPLPLALADQTGISISLNNCFISTFGYERTELETINAWWPLAYPDPEYREWVKENWRQDIQQTLINPTSKPKEFRIICKDGQQRSVIISTTLIGNDFLSCFSDVTELRQRNDELERFNKAMVGRELDMIALKRHVNALSSELGRPSPYPLDFLKLADVQGSTKQ